MKLKNVKLVAMALVITMMGAVLLSGCSQNPSPSSSSAPKTTSSSNTSVGGKDTDGDGIPDSAEKILGSNPYAADTDGDGINDKNDKDPVYTDNLIIENSKTVLPVTVTDKRVEDNATADHLEISIKNIGTSDLTNFDIYFTITDKVTSAKEAYYQKLGNLTVKAGATVTLHFDNNTKKANHYYGNMNGLYGTSSNGLTFDVKLHSTGYAPLSFTVDKAKGTAEVAD